MIDEVLGVLADKLNAHLLFEFGLPGDVVWLGPISDAQRASKSKLIVTLVQLTQDHTPRQSNPGPRTSPTAPLSLDMHMLVAANFEDKYTDGLAQLSAAISYFHARPVFAPDTTPGLPKGINRISVALEDTDLNSQAAMWAMLGHRYLPSALYRVRILGDSAR